MLTNEFDVPFHEITAGRLVRLAGADPASPGPAARVVLMHTAQLGVVEVHPEQGGQPYRTPFHVSRVRELLEDPPVAEPAGAVVGDLAAAA